MHNTKIIFFLLGYFGGSKGSLLNIVIDHAIFRDDGENGEFRRQASIASMKDKCACCSKLTYSSDLHIAMKKTVVEQLDKDLKKVLNSLKFPGYVMKNPVVLTSLPHEQYIFRATTGIWYIRVIPKKVNNSIYRHIVHW
jgi:hypothetical protein